MNRIILLSNKGVRPNRKGETLFKNKLTQSENRISCAEVTPGSKHKHYSLDLIAQGDEQNHQNQALANSNSNPWLFFVHGNNQTLHKNLKKCFALEQLYNVNIVAFSWPSVHHGKVRNLLSYIPSHVQVGKYLTRQLKRKLKQYKKARENAALSAADLACSLQMFKTACHGSEVTANFASHSLGNRVLRLSHQHDNLASTMACFSNILLHQADEDNENHRQWVDLIDKGKEVYITTNKKDKVLELSNIYNHKSMSNQRLGNVPKAIDDDVNSPTYKDFTGMSRLGFSGHTLFIIPPKKNPQTYSFFKPIIGH